MTNKETNPWINEFPTSNRKSNPDMFTQMFENNFLKELDKRLNIEPRKSTADVWYYDDMLRDYFLKIGKDNQLLETIGNYPRVFYYPNSWDNAFTSVSKDTRRDKKERFCIVGTDNKKGRVLLPINPAIGNGSQISHELRNDQITWARQSGADSVIGSFHSHPTQKSKTFVQRFSYNSTLSVPDFYLSTVPSYQFINGVIQTNGELTTVFKTAETHLQEELAYLPSGYRDQYSFSDHWYRTKGLVADFDKHTVRRQDNSKMASGEFLELIWQLNHEIADKHNLAVYHGKIGGGQARFHPRSTENEWHEFFIGKSGAPPKFRK